MRGYDFTEATFDAAHAAFGNPVHGHTWFVRVYWDIAAARDAQVVHTKLSTILDAWHHTNLNDQEGLDPTNSGVASAILHLMGDFIKGVRVWRAGRVPCGAEIWSDD